MKQFYTNKPLIFALALFIFVLGFLANVKNPAPTGNDDYKEKAQVDLLLAQKSDRSLERAPAEVIEKEDSLIAATIRAVSRKCIVDLSITPKSNTVVVGGSITYDMVIKNLGKTKCLNPSVSVYYSDSVAFVESTPSPSASNYYWKFPNLSLNQSYKVSFTTKHKSTTTVTGNIDLEACATADNSEDSCKNSSVLLSTDTSGGTGGDVVVPPPTEDPNTGTPPPSGVQEYGSWIWNSPIQMSSTMEQNYVNFASANGINVLYVTIDDYLNIYNMPAGAEKEAQKKAYGDALENFIKLANAKNIQVDAEAGWRDWAEAGVTWKAFAIIDYVKEFNSTRTTKLRGIQYDVEPYLLSTYETNKAKVLTNFVKLIDDSAQRLGTSNVAFSIVIPHFYDSEQRWTPSFTYGGFTTHTFNHLLRIMDTRPNSNIILMSYRNFAEGDDSVIEISQVEVVQASVSGSTTKVIVAQETGNVEPSYVTFYNTTRNYYEGQITIVRNILKAYKNFGGMAVHYIDPFMQLK